jgi:uncharacterized membrane protein YtjA (UPF0391 family)
MKHHITRHKDNSAIKLIFMMSVILHSYLISIVAGRIKEELIVAGFKHASVFVVIAVLAAKPFQCS